VEQRVTVGSIVFVVDDDLALRQAVTSLLQSLDLRVKAFGSAADFLKKARLNDAAAACLVLDVRLPGLSGLDFQSELSKASIQIPIIFISGFGDIPMTVRAMKAGAVEFLTKPFRGQELLDAIQEAINRDRAAWSERSRMQEVLGRYASLTPREKEVMHLVVAGMLNKQIAGELGASELTIKTHRGRVMEKMAAESVADLVRMAERLKLTASYKGRIDSIGFNPLR
jgi:FixJ family two-component response regulator